MKIAENKIEAIATALKVDKALVVAEVEKLDEAADVVYDANKGEYLTKDNRKVLEKNFERTYFNQAKTAHQRATYRALKDKYGIEADPESEDFETVLPKLETAIAAKANISEPEAVKTAKESLSKLQNNYKALEIERDQLKTKLENEGKRYGIAKELVSAIAALPIQGETPEKVSTQREVLQTMFEKKYTLDTEDGRTVVKDLAGVVIKDNLQNPMKLSDVLAGFAPGYVSLTPDGSGRGDGSTKNNNALSGDLKAIKNKGEFEAYLKAKNINPYGSEALALLQEVKAKNPDYK